MDAHSGRHHEPTWPTSLDAGDKWRQALAVLPLLTALCHDAEIDQAALCGLISQRQPLWRGLADLVQVRMATVRRLRALPMANIPSFWHARPVAMLKLLDRLPLDLQPATAADRKAFTRLVLMLDVYPRVPADLYLRLADWSMWGWPMRRDWLIQCGYMGWQTALNKLQRSPRAYIDMALLNNFFNDLAYHLWQQAKPDSPISRYAQLRQQYQQWGLWRVMRSARRWQSTYMPTFWNPAVVNTWAVPLLRPITLGPFTARFLSTRQELVDEGIAMNHCVANLDNSCARGRFSVVSLQQGPHRVATASLMLDRNNQALQFKCCELRGANNSPPSTAARQAIQQLLMLLNDDAAAHLRRGYFHAFQQHDSGEAVTIKDANV